MLSIDMFTVINVLLALFVLAFGLFSLRTVWGTPRQAAWLLLVALGLVLFTTQALILLSLAGYVSLVAVRPVMDTLFIVIMLFTVIFQYHLILTSQNQHRKTKKK